MTIRMWKPENRQNIDPYYDVSIVVLRQLSCVLHNKSQYLSAVKDSVVVVSDYRYDIVTITFHNHISR